jgi:hypothetical protein
MALVIVFLWHSEIGGLTTWLSLYHNSGRKGLEGKVATAGKRGIVCIILAFGIPSCSLLFNITCRPSCGIRYMLECCGSVFVDLAVKSESLVEWSRPELTSLSESEFFVYCPALSRAFHYCQSPRMPLRAAYLFSPTNIAHPKTFAQVLHRS